MTEFGVYVYGVVPDGALAAAPQLLGIDGEHPAELIGCGEIAAVISRVSLDQFGDDTLRTHLADINWVEATARGHQRVLDEVIEHCTPIPMRLCTIYGDESGLRSMLARENEALAGGLRELDSKLEWGVKGFAKQSVGAAQPSSAVAAARPATGTAYLQQRLAHRSVAAQSQADLDQACADVHQDMSELAAASRLNAVQRPEVSGRAASMAINASYLVTKERRDDFSGRFTAVRNGVAERGLELELTGPWPPYNFVPASIGGGL